MRHIKLVADMLYEACIQAVIDYKDKIERVRIYKGPARDIRLTRKQYLRVPPWWIANDYSCWKMIVDRWCSQEWLEMHEAARQRRLLMPSASHHQGNRNLKAYTARYVFELIFYSNAQFCVISNHLPFFAVGGTWWCALHSSPGILCGPQREDDV